MMDYAIVKSLFVAVIIGLLVGMQRSLSMQRSAEAYFAGSRTFALIALSGFLSGWLAQRFPQIPLLIGATLTLLLAIAYYLKVTRTGHWGMTTPMAAVVTYLLGMLTWSGQIEYAILIAVVVIILLEIKPRLQILEHHIGTTDVHAVVLLMAMSFVLLPILPDRMVDPWHLFNPYKTWLMAVIISAISFVGYLAIKILGKKHGVFLTGAAGGLISSTAVSISLSKMFDKQWPLLNNYAGGIAIASSIMYLRVLFEALIIHPNLALKLTPAYLAAAGSGLLFSGWLYRQSADGNVALENDPISKNPLQLSEAIKFGILFGIIYGAITLVQTRYGSLGVYLVSAFSGLSDVDAITLSLSQMARDGKTTELVSLYGIAIASISNSLVKLGIVYWLGGRKLGWKLTQFYLVTLGALGTGLWLMQ